MKKQLWALCCILSGLTQANINATAPAPMNSFVTITAAVGIAQTHTTAVENLTDEIPDVSYYPPYMNPTMNNIFQNTYAKWGAGYNPIYVATSTGGTVDQPVYGWVQQAAQPANTAATSNPYLPQGLNAVTYTPPANSNGLTATQLFSNQVDPVAKYKQDNFVAAYLDFSQNLQLLGATGVDAGLSIGYKQPISGWFFIHPQVAVGYLNNKSENAGYTRFQDSSFWVKGGTINSGIASSTGGTTNTTPVNCYAIEPDTVTTQSYGGSIPNALTFQAQMYVNFLLGFGHQFTDKFSCEVQVGYQMTRMKMAVQEVNNVIDATNRPFLQYDDKSTLNTAFVMDAQKTLFNFADSLDSAEEEAAKWISGVYLGFGLQFAIAKNLTMGVNMYHVFNAQREFQIDGVVISPTVKSPAATANTQNAATQAGTTPTATPVAGNALENDEVQDVNIKAAQDITGLRMTLTYSIPVGANDCSPGA